MDPKMKAMKMALESIMAGADAEENDDFKKDAGVEIEVKTKGEPEGDEAAAPQKETALDRYKKILNEGTKGVIDDYNASNPLKKVGEGAKETLDKLKQAQEKIDTGAKKTLKDLGQDAKTMVDQTEALLRENGFKPELLTNEEKQNLVNFIKKAKGQGKPDAGM